MFLTDEQKKQAFELARAAQNVGDISTEEAFEMMLDSMPRAHQNVIDTVLSLERWVTQQHEEREMSKKKYTELKELFQEAQEKLYSLRGEGNAKMRKDLTTQIAHLMRKAGSLLEPVEEYVASLEAQLEAWTTPVDQLEETEGE